MRNLNTVFIIAEAGVNHNGSLSMAKELVDAAVEAGADAVKFQTFKAEDLVTESAKQAEYQIENTGIIESQFEMLKRLELSQNEFLELKKYCDKRNIEFMTTAFDLKSLKFIAEELGVKRLKIPSGDITNGPLLLESARYKLPLILSTGMSTSSEVEMALGVIAFGMTSSNSPSTLRFSNAYLSDLGKEQLKENVTILHCTSNYPALINSININAMKTMAKDFGLQVGYSDHSDSSLASIVAVSNGAKVIEKHFTIDCQLPGPDHKASLSPAELVKFIQILRDTEKVLGSPIKAPTATELDVQKVARKSLVVTQNINKGDILSIDNLSIKRPGHGISPMKYWSYLNKISKKNYLAGDLIHE